MSPAIDSLSANSSTELSCALRNDLCYIPKRHINEGAFLQDFLWNSPHACPFVCILCAYFHSLHLRAWQIEQTARHRDWCRRTYVNTLQRSLIVSPLKSRAQGGIDTSHQWRLDQYTTSANGRLADLILCLINLARSLWEADRRASTCWGFYSLTSSEFQATDLQRSESKRLPKSAESLYEESTLIKDAVGRCVGEIWKWFPNLLHTTPHVRSSSELVRSLFRTPGTRYGFTEVNLTIHGKHEPG
jgi:hypothetical protein